MANGRRFIYYRDQTDGRADQAHTEAELQLGPPVNKIPRAFDENVYAINDDGNVNFFNEMSWLYIAHDPIGKQIQTPNRAGIPAIDEMAQVNAFSAGDNGSYTSRT